MPARQASIHQGHRLPYSLAVLGGPGALCANVETCWFAFIPFVKSACSVAATYKPPMLVPRVRLPAGALPLGIEAL